jgi:hypothetical protein
LLEIPARALFPLASICSHCVETDIRSSESLDFSFIGLKNKSCSENALSQLWDGSCFILVEEAFINQRSVVYFSFGGNEKSEKRK